MRLDKALEDKGIKKLQVDEKGTIRFEYEGEPDLAPISDVLAVLLDISFQEAEHL